MNRFRDNMNGHLYGMALVHDNLESARASSALLTSAIFTVTSLHMPRHQHLYRVLYPVFLSLVSTCMFDRYHRLDDVRGLCIGAFYLFEISWKLSGHAVRMATEMNLHQSFHKALAGSKEHYERARLWYLLYVCDHHFSIVHGRPPVMCDHEPMKKWEAYLQSPLATEGDYLVLSQVTLFTILTRIFHFFEDEAEHEISDDLLSHIPAFNERLDDWRETWHAKLPSRMSVVTGTPSKGVDLHYHFAKLQLNSLVLRGVNPSTVERLGSRRKVIANDAVASAIAVLSIILEEPAIRDTLLSAPLYLDTMVSCAASFLLKITAKWMPISFDISTDQVWALVERTIALLNSHSGTVSEFHIISQVANGLGKLLRKCIDISKANSPVDDSRLWNGSSVQENGGLVEQHSPHEHGVATYPVGHGQQQQPHPQQPSQQQQQQHQFWQSYQHQPGSSHDVGSEVLYSPQGGMHTGQSGQQPIYEVNGQYFPVPMGVFDFLSPQLPY
ncbi:Similar to Transcriptional activator of proteases prtT; acc. no. Q5B8L0 [Pyronema omphalodes CBS 100304]|uniref:Similar to Transcriptional activator of proteases prtT acc. no. Q5B8L0 n=1 Tax=Pyronema omphalodes (strain CBS 100304) TaxID=1076935 RepID=U4L9Z6_PYROM|nr:Similar to Transcriptional activator of proteases prtT; acc. no. Q5B8L0 [Pyronema omphalodes CBS 100304]